MKVRDFVVLVRLAAQASAKPTDVPASFTVAEAALEPAGGE